MRYIVTVDGNWLPGAAAATIQQNVTATLRRVWIKTGLDYSGFSIRALEVDGFPDISLKDIMLRAEGALRQQESAELKTLTRFIIAQKPTNSVESESETTWSDLLISVVPGSNSSWGPGFNQTHASVTFETKASQPRIEATICDVFQDIMIANNSMLTHLRHAFLRRGNSIQDYLALKAEYAQNWVRENRKPLVFEKFEPKQYASFSSLARTSTLPGQAGVNSQLCADLWAGFANKHLSDYFLQVDQAVDFLTKNKFRTPKSGLRDIDGVTIGKAVLHNNIAEREIREAISRQTVPQNGLYILIVKTREPRSDKEAQDLGSIMGWINPKEKRTASLKLVRPSQYEDFAKFVQSGLVCPIWMFIKR